MKRSTCCQAGPGLTPQQFVLAWFGSGMLAFALLLLVTGAPVVLLALVVLLAFLPRQYFPVTKAGHTRSEISHEGDR